MRTTGIQHSESASYQLNDAVLLATAPPIRSSIGSNEEQEPENDEGQEPEDGA